MDNNNVNTNYNSNHSLRFKLFCPLAVASVLRGVVTCDLCWRREETRRELATAERENSPALDTGAGAQLL